MQTAILLTPALKHYDWGDRHYIPDLLSLPSADRPCAEAWFGAHPLAPARAEAAGLPAIALDQFLTDRPDVLGPGRGTLPYLLKVLAADKPLSIQVHPNREQARVGFAREEAAGIPRDAATRSYRDDNHKPEILAALTTFHALCGFRSAADIAARIAALPSLAALVPFEADGDVRDLIERYFALDRRSVEAAWSQALTELRARGDAKGDESEPAFWLLRAHEQISGGGAPDPGLLFVLLLELVALEPGQALFLPAGVPHAYLRGAGVELMASSDNVLRAGLTSKHVDAAELMRVVRFDARRPPILEAIFDEEGREGIYPVPARELDLRRLRTGGGALLRCARGAETLLVSRGPRGESLRVKTGDGTLCLTVGQACLVPDGAAYTIEGDGSFEIVRVSNAPAPAPRFRGRVPTELAFGTSGLRGLVEDITDLEVYVNARGFLHFCIDAGDAAPGSRVALGADLRPSSERILRIVARAACDAGLVPVHCGTIPTPALTFFGMQKGWPSIMVTGSHIPFDRNGIKFNTSRGEIRKEDEADILRATAAVREIEYARAVAGSAFDDAGRLRSEPSAVESAGAAAEELYRRRYLQALPERCLSGLRIAFYQHSAVGRDLIPGLLADLGAEVQAIGRSSEFVAIDTEAVDEAMMRSLQALADDARARHGDIDALVSTDGDSDRPLVLTMDASGTVRFLPGDALGALVAEYLRADAAVVPVSASDVIEMHLGAEVPVTRTRIGSPWVIAGMADVGAARTVGWEANGGFLTGTDIPLERAALSALPTRDAVLPIVAFLHAARRADLAPSELAARLPARAGRSALLDDVDPARSQALIAAFGPDRIDARARLAAVFSPEHGYGSIESVDYTDGIRLRFSGGDIAHVRPSGNAPQLRIYAVSDTDSRARSIVDHAVAPGGALERLLDAADDSRFARAVLANIEVTQRLFREGSPTQVIGAVAGTRAATEWWRAVLAAVAPSFGARKALAFHEDLPVNQGLGVLLLWQRLREHLEAREGALVAFVFGDGSRVTPFTEAECGQKPALSSFVRDDAAGSRRFLSIGELALRHFVPVETYLRRSGFEGVVLKWGDEVQIPTRPLVGSDPLFAGADIVRFVSMQALTEDTAASKDWVGVSADGEVTAFIPRRPLADMVALADEGRLERRGGAIYGGINLGSIAVSRVLLDVLLDELEDEVNDASASRRDRPDLDPQLFTAMTIAAETDAEARAERWRRAVVESAAMRALDTSMPGILDRLRRAFDRFRQDHGRDVKMVAMDFGEQFWGDVGQHRSMRELIVSLRESGAHGVIARALAGLPQTPDERGNFVAGDTWIGEDASVEDSVLIDARIACGSVARSVLIGTETDEITASGAFDIGSTAPRLDLGEGAGSYKIVSEEPVSVTAGERATTVFLPDGPRLMRAMEDTDLRDRAASYDTPIGANEMSFSEVHRRVIEAEPSELLQARKRAREAVRLRLRSRD